MANKKNKQVKRRSFEAMSLRVYVSKVIEDKRKKSKTAKITKRNWDIEL